MSEEGRVLGENNTKIIACLCELKEQREEINMLIERQEQEQSSLQSEIDKINYKLNLISKSLSQRLVAREHYDKTIQEAEEQYRVLVKSSSELLTSIKDQQNKLGDVTMDKKIGTDNISVSSRSIESMIKTLSKVSVSSEQESESADEEEGEEETNEICNDCDNSNQNSPDNSNCQLGMSTIAQAAREYHSPD